MKARLTKKSDLNISKFVQCNTLIINESLCTEIKHAIPTEFNRLLEEIKSLQIRHIELDYIANTLNLERLQELIATVFKLNKYVTCIKFYFTNQQFNCSLIEKAILNASVKSNNINFVLTPIFKTLNTYDTMSEIKSTTITNIIQNSELKCFDLSEIPIISLKYDEIKQITDTLDAKDIISARLLNLNYFRHHPKKFTNFTYEQQQDLAYLYLKFIAEYKYFSYHADLNDIPFDLHANKDAFYELINNFTRTNKNVEMLELITHHLQTKLTHEQLFILKLKCISFEKNCTQPDYTDITPYNLNDIIASYDKEKLKTVIVALECSRLLSHTKYKYLYFSIMNHTYGYFKENEYITLTEDECLHLANKFQSSFFITLYVRKNVKTISRKRRMELAQIASEFHTDSFKYFELDPIDIIEIFRQNQTTIFIVEALLNEGVNKNQTLELVSSFISELDARNHTLSLNILELNKNEILDFAIVNPTWAQVLDHWADETKTTEPLHELFIMRLKNSKDKLTIKIINNYKIPLKELNSIMTHCCNTFNIESEVIKLLEWETIYTILKNKMELESTNFDLLESVKDIYMINQDILPEHTEELILSTIDYDEILPNTFSSEEIREKLLNNLHNIFTCFFRNIQAVKFIDVFNSLSKSAFTKAPTAEHISLMFNTYRWIVDVMIRLSEDFPSKTIIDFIDKPAIIKTLHAIFCLPSLELKFQFINLLFKMPNNKQSTHNLEELLKNTNKRSILPAFIIASHITKAIDFKSFLNIIDSKYKDNNKLIILLNGLLTLFASNDISDSTKLNIIHEIFSYNLHINSVNSEVELRDLHAARLNNNTLRLNAAFLTRIKTSSTESIFGLQSFDVDGKVLDLINIELDERFIDTHRLLKALDKSGKVISRNTKDILSAIKNSNALRFGWKHEKQSLLMLQHLTNFKQLDLIERETNFNNITLESRVINTLEKCYNIPASKLPIFLKTLSQYRDKIYLIAYGSKLKIKSSNAPYAIMFELFVHLLASPYASDFYKYRYNLHQQPHLKAVIQNNSDLLHLWRSGFSIDYNFFNGFVPKGSLDTSVAPVTIRALLIHKIKHLKHLSVKEYKHIHKYLNATSEAEKKTIYMQTKNKYKFIACKTSDENQQKIENNLVLQIGLMDYFNAKSTLNASDEHSKMGIILKIFIDTKSDANLFVNDIYNIYNQILTENSAKPKYNAVLEQDTKNWVLKDTDNFWHMFMIGSEVEGSCLNIHLSSSTNYCLIGGYVLSGHIRQIAIIDAQQKIVARAVLRLMRDQNTLATILYLEDIYPNVCNNKYTSIIESFAQLRAWQLGCTLLDSKTYLNNKIYLNPIEVVAVKGAEYVDALTKVAHEGYIIHNSHLLFDYPSQLDIANRKITGNPSYNPRPLDGVPDLAYMYRNYKSKTDATMPEFFEHINLSFPLRLT